MKHSNTARHVYEPYQTQPRGLDSPAQQGAPEAPSRIAAPALTPIK